MTRPDGIIFDLDGTLLNTLDDIGLSLNRVLQRYGLATHSLDCYRHFIGQGVASLLSRASGLKADDPKLTHIGQEFREDYAQHWQDHTTLYDGIPELLDHLSESKTRIKRESPF
ncbi:MAG: HAD hydrolase-like protein [FCB group bacterium]|nr:HAD hydrolase-like protein [FCB group bacterium]